jgi:hypothetical protein
MKNRVNIKNLVSDQLPSFVRDGYPEFVEFLKDYYDSLEFPGGPVDILNNIDEYTKLDNITELTYYTELTANVDYGAVDISVSSTDGFPLYNGLLQIDNEIILYESKNQTTFLNCKRGFSGITTYTSPESETLTFSTSIIDAHTSNTIVYNLHSLFLAELYKKFKYQYAPGFEDIEFYKELNEKILVSNLKDFYASKGANSSFDILFKSIWGSPVQIIKPRDFLIQPSDADYRITRDLVIKRLSGNPQELVNKTLYQDETQTIPKAAGSITNVEQLFKDGEEYFRLSLDYNPELETFNFTVHPKTKITNPVGLGQTYLDVDSTLSFTNSGTLVVFDNNVEYKFTYSGKSCTQFFGLSSPIAINLNQDITTPDYAYAISESGDQIRVKITGVLGDLELDRESSYYYELEDQVEIVSLGADSEEQIRSSWINNVSPEYEIEQITQVALKLNGAAQYRIKTYDPNIFTLGDIGTIKGSDGNQYDIFVIAVSNKYEFDVNLTTRINTSDVRYSIRKGISKTKSNNQPEINIISADIQNVYTDDDDTYVVSSSLPNYYNTPIIVEDLSVTFTGQYDGFDINIGSNSFISGEAVYYSRNNNVGLNIAEGPYFVYKVNSSTIRLATSRANIRSGQFVYVFGTVLNNKISLLKYYNRRLQSQDIIRKFSPSVDDDIIENRTTKPGTVGLFLNGVEALNYKSSDTIYSGPIEEIVVSSVGDANYDVINPPVMVISDNVGVGNTIFGSGAEGICNVVGTLSRINILDKGFDYTDEPKITISGGNGTGAEAKANLSKIIHSVSFNAGSLYDQVNLSENSIGFTTYHKFRDFERVIYNSQNQPKISNLVDDAIYFVKIITPTKIKLHNTLDDAITGINTVILGSYGEGLQKLTSSDKKKVISSIEVITPGRNYTNKTLFFDKDSISTFNNTIKIINHGYTDKEIILFNSDGVLPVGLNTNSEYYVKVVDKNTFRVASVEPVGVGSTISSDYNYVNRRFIDFNDGGLGQHSIKYQSITLKIESPIGVTTFAGQDFNAKVRPIFTGSIQSVSLKNKGDNYGDPNVVNYNRQPDISLLNGENAQISVIVSSQGKIIGAIVNNPGSNYNSPPLLEVLGSGSGAILVPIIVNGAIVDVKIIESGFNYSQVDTTVKVVPTGSNARFEAKIKSWNINVVERIFQSDQVNSDDGIITTPLASERGLQFTHAYAARELRKKLLATSLDLVGNTVYREDIENDNNPVKYHSPIIGWAYDGNPIYGPYGYADKEGGAVVRLNSGYELNLQAYRPSTSSFPPGYFIQDYEFTNNGDLDIHNGRYCKTPEFPNGVYAYFATVNSIKNASGPFNGFLKPVFPYIIGDTFKSKIIDYNFDQYSNLSFVDLNNTGWIRYTTPLGLLLNKTRYQGFIQPDTFSRGFTEVSSVSSGELTELQIISPGDNYSIQDNIFFNSQGTGGSGAYARISEIKGRDVSSISYSFSKLVDVEFTPFGSLGKFVGFASTSHSLINGDIVSVQNLNILSTNFASSYVVGISTNTLTLSNNTPNASQTGIVTYLNVSGNLNFPVASVNDVYKIGPERVKIINVYPQDSRIKVYRSFGGSTSIAHTAGDSLIELSRKITFNSGFSTSTEYKLNSEYYFDPRESAIIPSENLILYSNPIPPSLVPTAWDYYSVGVGTGSVEYFSDNSPDGSNNAAKVAFASTTGSSDAFGIKYESVSLSSGNNTFSVFLRGHTGGEQVYFILDDGGSYYSQLVTLTTNWRRYSLTALTGAGLHRIRIGTYGPQGLTLNSSPTFYVWGAQVELGSLTSSYYSTSGSPLSRASQKSGLLFFSNPGVTQKKGIKTIPNTFYLPNHGFKTGDKVKYNVGHGYTGVSVSYGTTTTPLLNSQTLYIASYDSDFIGVSTQRIGIGSTGGFVGIGSDVLEIFKIANYGTGEVHSIKTDLPLTIRGDVYKKTATVITEREHGLTNGDIVDLKVISGVSTTFYVTYDDINRRMLINPRSFIDTDINLSRNTITIPNHGLINGQKVIYNSATPSAGLINSKLYYIVVSDDNTILLSNYYYDIISSNDAIEIVEIGTQAAGTIAPVNPELFGVKNSTLVFDLSDPTLASNSVPAFEFNFYFDALFQKEFYTTDSNKGAFNIRKSGVIGEPGAKLELVIDDFVPSSLYYNLTPIDYSGATASKLEIISDKFNIKNGNKLSLINSKFNEITPVSGITTNSFTYALEQTPERINYNKTEAKINYTTKSSSAIGPVAKINIDSGGRNYIRLPNVAQVVSGLGTAALFLPRSKTIGKVNSVVLTDIGFDYPSDKTLRPLANFPYTYKIEPLSKFKRIQIVNPGINYFVAPQLAVVDGFTGRVNTEVSLEYDIGDTEVRVVRNTTGLYNVTPKIIPINNPNGVRIDNIVFDPGTLNVTVSFAVTFASSQDYPFIVGEKIIVENTNVDINFGGRGYNSAAYDYRLFRITAADPDIGGDNPTLTFNLTGFLSPGEDPGLFDGFESFGTATPESYFPIFDIDLEKDSFRDGEIIVAQDGNFGVVQSYDRRNEYLKIRSKKIFKVDDLIIGSSSQNKGLISSVDGIRAKYLIDSNSITKKGWLRETGKLNQSFQRLHDNDYYQYFSYSVRSPIEYQVWNPLVSNLTHTAGFKKFSELIIDSYDPTVGGISTAQNLNALVAISDLTEIVDLNSIKDFDIAREKSIQVNDTLVSNEILFNLPFLAQYQEFIGNRVLTVDDFSDQFNGVQRGFELKSGNYPIFEVILNGSDPNLISFTDGTLNLTNHYFVSGEEIEYIPPDNDFTKAIKITPTNFGPGIGTTSFLPSKFIVIKQDNQKIRVAVSATDALLFNPIGVGITGVGIGSTHTFRSISPNNRMLVTINGTIQSPLVGTAYTIATTSSIGIGTTNINVVGVTSIFSGDLIQIDNEIMLVSAVNSVTNVLNVKRAWMGTTETTHTTNTVVTKFVGNYNVAQNKLHFSEPMWGNIPVGFGTTATSANEVDYTGLTTSSRFSGRVFLRSALTQAFTTSFIKAYDNNYVFDDISSQFNGITTTFTLKYQGNNIGNIISDNTIILINDIFQGPQRLGNVLTNIPGDYKLISGGGQLQVGFGGPIANPSITNDINVNNAPRGGIIVSVGSTEGFGYQPLVAAGGTALVSSAGTITQISIGNSGSGYRSGLQTVKVGIQTASYGSANITYIGIASVLNGHVVGVAITNPKVFYVPRQVTNIGYSSITGVTTVTTSTPHGLQLGEEVSIVGAAFTCDYYPPIGVSTAVYNNVTGIMTVTTVGVTTLNVVSFTYDNTTGLSTVVTSQPHNLITQTAIGRSFSLAGLALTCVGYGQTFAVYDFIYDNTTGLSTVFIVGNHGLNPGDNFKMRELEFSCTGPSGVTTTIFPDGTQGYFFTVNTVGTTTSFTVNVGASTIPHTYVSGGVVQVGINTDIFPGDLTVSPLGNTFKVLSAPDYYTFTFNSGISTIPHSYVSGGTLTLGHKLKVGTDIILTGLGFTGSLGIVTHPNINTTDYCGTQVTRINNISQFELNVGVGSTPLTYVSGGTVEEIIIAPRQINNSPTGQDPAANGTGVVKIVDDYTFIINSGTSPYTHFYKKCGSVTKPLDVIFDNPLNYYNVPLIYKQGVVGFGTGATVDLVPSQDSTILNFEINNFGYGYGSGEILTVAIGGTIGIPTTGISTFKNFELTIDRTYQSKFSGWNVGEFIVLDDISVYFNGRRRLFPLTINGESISFFAKANSGINLQSNLLVFINDTLQTPGEGYQFNGGSTLRFTEAPKGAVAGFSTIGDKAKVLMYTGTQSIDVKTVDVLPSVKVGDDVQLYSDTDDTFTEEQRLVMDVVSADKIITNNYGGQGVTLNELFSRPISWFKQTVDKIIDNEFVGKDRIYYEPIINPSTNIIESVGIGSTYVFVYNIRPLFDDSFEGIPLQERSIIEIINQENLDTATATATIGAGGSISNITITNPGYGYTIAPEITVQRPYGFGTQATASATIGAGGSITSITVGTGGTNYYYGPLGSLSISQQGSGFPPLQVGQNTFYNAKLKSQSGIGRGATADIQISVLNFNIASISITNGGANYAVGDILYVDTFDNVGLATTSRKWALRSPMKFSVSSILPPPVLIAPPKRSVEEVIRVDYEGDYGIIVGVGTTSCSGVTTCLGLELDLFIPLDSRIRKSLNISKTGITTGYLFNVVDSGFGTAPQTSLRSDGSILGISTQFVNMTFECTHWYTKQAVIPPGISGLASTVGIATTVTTVVVKLLNNPPSNIVGFGTTAFYGKYTWGKINMPVRVSPAEFLAQHGTKQSGIGTNPVIRRKNSLKYLGYLG